MHDLQKQNQFRFIVTVCLSLFSLKQIMYEKTIIRFGFWNILNNEGLDKCYQPQPSAQLITLTSTLIIPDITKTSSNNNIIIRKNQLKHDNIKCLTWILLKYCPASKGTTLYVEIPVIGSSVGFVAV